MPFKLIDNLGNLIAEDDDVGNLESVIYRFAENAPAERLFLLSLSLPGNKAPLYASFGRSGDVKRFIHFHFDSSPAHLANLLPLFVLAPDNHTYDVDLDKLPEAFQLFIAAQNSLQHSVPATLPSTGTSASSSTSAIPPMFNVSMETRAIVANRQGGMHFGNPGGSGMNLEYDHLFEVVLLGDPGVGKSCLLRRFVDNIYTNSYISTIGADYKARTLQQNNSTVKLKLWDIAGEGRFHQPSSKLIRSAHGHVICINLTDHACFDNTKKWMEEVKYYSNGAGPILFVGTKYDLIHERQVSDAEFKALCEECQVPGIMTSAKNSVNNNVDSAFQILTAEIQRMQLGATAGFTPLPAKSSLFSRLFSIFNPVPNKARRIPAESRAVRPIASSLAASSMTGFFSVSSESPAARVKIASIAIPRYSVPPQCFNLSQDTLHIMKGTPAPSSSASSSSSSSSGGGRNSDYDSFHRVEMWGGDRSGKTSLLLRYADGTYTDAHLPGIGVGFKIRMEQQFGNRVSTQVWDKTSRYEGPDRLEGVIICVDLTDSEAITVARAAFAELAHVYFDGCVVFAATKSDSSDRKISDSNFGQFCRELDVPGVITSARNATHVDLPFQIVCAEIQKKRGVLPESDIGHGPRK